MTDSLTHLNAAGEAHMVDVSDKPDSARTASAAAWLQMQPKTLERLLDGQVPKGDVFATARIAGIQAAKKTSELIPLCHPLPLTGVTVELVPDANIPGVRIITRTRTTGRTGVEMEALAAASGAALTLYDMCKGIDRHMVIGGLQVTAKAGGRSGNWSLQNDSEETEL